MEDDGILNATNPIHIAVLHIIFLNEINKKLTTWNYAWSHHRLRTTKQSPLKLWLSGQIQSSVGINIRVEDVANYCADTIPHTEGNNENSNDLGDIADTRPVFEEPTMLSEEILTKLKQQISTNCVAQSADFGVDVFKKALSILSSL